MTTLRSNLTATTGALALACAFLFSSAPANALGLKDCSDKYSASKSKKTFAEFQKSDCGPDAKPVAAPAAKPADAKPADAKPADAKPAAAATTATPAPTAADKKAADKAAAKAARDEKRKADAAAKDAAAKAAAASKPAAPAAAKPATAAPAAAASAAVFPTAIADAFKAKKPSKARFATCLAQYKANKATNANGGLKWIQKGGGYYAQCNKKLKG